MFYQLRISYLDIVEHISIEHIGEQRQSGLQYCHFSKNNTSQHYARKTPLFEKNTVIECAEEDKSNPYYCAEEQTGENSNKWDWLQSCDYDSDSDSDFELQTMNGKIIIFCFIFL